MTRAVLITGARAAAALDLARDFVAAGWQVHLGDSRRVRMALWSRVAAQHHRYPPPRQQAAAFRAWIGQLVADHAIDLVVPTCEEVFHLAAPTLHSQLGQRLFAPDLASLRILHDKLAFAHAAQGWGLPAPESHAVNSPAELSRFQASSRDWVFKPRFSRFGDRALIGPEPAALARLDPTPQAPWLAQRRIVGHEACLHAVAHDGQLVAFSAYGSDWRLGGGARYAFEPLADEHHLTLRALAETLAKSSQITGQFACDVMIDAAGTPWLLECNPRATSGVHLLVGDGALARAIGDGHAAPAIAQRSAYLAPAMWLFGLPQALTSGRLKQWRAMLVSGVDVLARPGDRLPVAGALVDAAAFMVTGLRHGIATNAATTHDIEWNGEDLD